MIGIYLFNNNDNKYYRTLLSEHIPRIGEMLDLGSEGDPQIFIIDNVLYDIKNNNITCANLLISKSGVNNEEQITQTKETSGQQGSWDYQTSGQVSSPSSQAGGKKQKKSGTSSKRRSIIARITSFLILSLIILSAISLIISTAYIIKQELFPKLNPTQEIDPDTDHPMDDPPEPTHKGYRI